MIYAYTRETPGRSGKEKLKKQVSLMEQENPDKVVIEKLPTGKEKKYDVFWKMFHQLKPGDTLVIPSIDRVSHSANDFSGMLAGLLNRGVKVRVLNMGTFDNSTEGMTWQRAIKAFAEFEKAMIVERTQESKAAAREDITFREGRPKKFTRQEISAALKMLEAGNSFREVSKKTGISASTLQRERNAERARRSGNYSMSDAEIREYEAAVAAGEQMTLEELL